MLLPTDSGTPFSRPICRSIQLIVSIQHPISAPVSSYPDSCTCVRYDDLRVMSDQVALAALLEVNVKDVEAAVAGDNHDLGPTATHGDDAAKRAR